jgi:iron complex outermembrane receptor protein
MPNRFHALAAAVAVSLAAPAMATPAAAADAGNDPRAEESESRAVELDAVIVTARAARLYRSETTSVGRLPGDPLDTPIAITVITADLIRDQGARDAQDLYRNISGVTKFSYAGVTARGFRQEEIFYDGLRGDPYAGFSVPQLFNIERVEFLKGPAGMLYGAGAPGGLFNYVTKTPSREASAQAGLVLGQGQRLGGQAELNGPIGRSLSARTGLFIEQRDLPRFNADSDTRIVDAGLAFDFVGGRLIGQATHYDQDLGGNRLRGVPTDNAGNFLADRRWNHNEASDFLRLESSVLQVRGEFQPSDGLSFDFGWRYNDASEAQQYHEPRSLVDTNRDGVPDLVTREFRDQFRTQETHSLGTNAVWSTTLFGLPNRVLAGADHFTGDALFDGRLVRGLATPRAGLPGPLSLRNPVYGQTNSATYVLPPFTRSLTDSVRTGAYALNELTLGRFLLTAGIRHDQFEDQSGTQRFSDDDFSYRTGLVWQWREDVSLFSQWATSFEPQGISRQDVRAGGPFDPTTGEIIEAGIKTALGDGRLQGSASVYRIVRANVLQADPRGDVAGDGVNDFVAFGEVTSEGGEIDLSLDLTPDWVLMLAYAYNDTRITRDNGRGGFVNNVGNRFANAPRHALGFWTRYQLPGLGLAFAFGGDHVSERISLSNQRVKPYTVYDASVTWTRGAMEWMLRVDNLFDKTYAASGFIDRAGHFPGEPRSAFIEARYRF